MKLIMENWKKWLSEQLPIPTPHHKSKQACSWDNFIEGGCYLIKTMEEIRGTRDPETQIRSGSVLEDLIKAGQNLRQYKVAKMTDIGTASKSVIYKTSFRGELPNRKDPKSAYDLQDL